MAASKSPRARLLHIRDEIEGAAATVKGLSFETYRASYIHRRAVERAVQIISEAAGALSADLLSKYSDAPWASIIGIGNVFTSTSGSTTGACGKSRTSTYPLSSRSSDG
jgi:uncharacterized protein with HEPN domain